MRKVGINERRERIRIAEEYRKRAIIKLYILLWVTDVLMSCSVLVSLDCYSIGVSVQYVHIYAQTKNL